MYIGCIPIWRYIKMGLSRKMTVLLGVSIVPSLLFTPVASAEVIDLTGHNASQSTSQSGGTQSGGQNNSPTGTNNSGSGNVNSNPGKVGAPLSPAYPGGIRPDPVEGLQPAFEGSDGALGVDQIAEMDATDLDPNTRAAAVGVAAVDLIQQSIGSPRTHLGPNDIAALAALAQAASTGDPVSLAKAVNDAGPATKNAIAEAKQTPAYANAIIHAPATLADNAGVTDMLIQMQRAINDLDTSGLENLLNGISTPAAPAGNATASTTKK